MAVASNLNELLEDINARVANNLIYPQVLFHEQAFLQIKGDNTFPVIDHGSRKGSPISMNGKYPLQCYHRVLSSTTETDYAGGKGKYPYRWRVYTIRYVWLGNVRLLPQKTHHSADVVKNNVYSAMPVVLTSKEIIKTNSEEIDARTVLDEEFNGFDFSNLSLDTVAFWIEYEIRQKIKCN